MSLAGVLSAYLTLNLLWAVGFLSCLGIESFLKMVRRPLGARTELRLHYFILFSVIGIISLYPLLPRSVVFEPPAKIWSSESIKTFSNKYTVSDRGGYLLIPGQGSVKGIEANRIAKILFGISLFVLLFGGLRFGYDIKALLSIQRRSFLVRRIGRIEVLINETIQVPFSYWFPFTARVIIPADFLHSREKYKMALFHELQHHRQGDTKWVFVLWGFRVFCIFNPFLHFWCRWLNELQEFACDEALIKLGKVKSPQYARCLIEVAESALHEKYAPACATGLTFLVERNLLKRRIQRMMTKTNGNLAERLSIALGIGVMVLMAGVTYASKGLVQDRRVSVADAEAMAQKVARGSQFPITVNELVVKQLNRYIGTPEGREYMKNALARMESYKPLVEAKLAEYQVPAELRAIPIIESGYSNLPDSNKQGWGAGIWMFIANTARQYGLRVDSAKDERLNIDVETDAAMRMLKAEQLRFKDWQLAVLAYNAGHKKVHEGIVKTGSRDVWTLIRNGFENDSDYYPKIMAAILIMHNPESIE